MELKGLLNSVFGRETKTSFSRRDALAGLGLAGALLAAPKLLAAAPAEAKPLDKAAEAQGSKPAPDAKKDDQTHVTEAQAADASDATDLSSRHHWHHHHHHHRHWHRRHWGWRRRHWGWRRRHWGWRHRHWHRRYW